MVMYLATDKKGNLLTQKGYILQPKPKFKGGSIKWLPDKKKEGK